MPAPILGGIFIVILGMLSILGLSCLEYADMTSDRNLIVTGVALMSGLAVPNFIDKYGQMLDTGENANSVRQKYKGR
jgi:xanthine/uracil permease